MNVGRTDGTRFDYARQKEKQKEGPLKVSTTTGASSGWWVVAVESSECSPFSVLYEEGPLL